MQLAKLLNYSRLSFSLVGLPSAPAEDRGGHNEQHEQAAETVLKSSSPPPLIGRSNRGADRHGHQEIDGQGGLVHDHNVAGLFPVCRVTPRQPSGRSVVQNANRARPPE